MTNEAAASPTATTPATAGVNLRRKKKVEGRKKRTLKLKTDPEFAKAYFGGKSKRAIEKKAAFRKKKTKKK